MSVEVDVDGTGPGTQRPEASAESVAEARTVQSNPGLRAADAPAASMPSSLRRSPPSVRARERRAKNLSPLDDPRLSRMPFKIGDVLVDKYLVERVLGEGGAGVVVAATNLDLDEPVALKFLKQEMSSHAEVVARFAREAKAAASIKSEHVAKVLDVGQLPDGTPFIVMEYLEGEDLYRLVKDRGALPITEAVEYVLQACEALAVAHAKGIIHRDLKPENLFLQRHDDAALPVVKVLDFGISKSALTGAFGIDAAAFRTSHQLGTPAYMSPEQVRSATEVDARSDIFAFGLVLYELLTGRHAFSAKTVPEMCAAILEQTPTPLTKLRAEIPQELAAVVDRCLSKDPAARYPDVAALATALLAFAPKRARISVERAVAVLQKAGRNATSAVLSTNPPADDVGLELELPATRAQKGDRASSSSQLPMAAVRTNMGAHERTKKSVPLVAVLTLVFGGIVFALVAWPAGRSDAGARVSPAHASESSADTRSSASPARAGARAVAPVASATSSAVLAPAPLPAATASSSSAAVKAPAPSAKKPSAKAKGSDDVDLGF